MTKLNQDPNSNLPLEEQKDSKQTNSKQKDPIAFGIFGVSLLLGIIADNLLRTPIWGLNFTIITICLAIALYILKRQHKAKVCFELLIPIIIFAGLFSFRASVFLQGLNLFLVLFCLLFLAAKATAISLQISNFGSYLINALRTGLILPFSPLILLFETPWSKLATQKNNAWAGTLRGLVFAVPIVIVFSFLLSSADAVFNDILSNIFKFDLNLQSILDHLFAILMFTVLFTAILRSSLLGENWQKIEVNTPQPLQFGLIETTLVFGSLVVLFTSFMAVQFYHFFGGVAALEKTGLTYSEYGRSGFFELVAVTILLHLLLLVGLWLVPKSKPLARDTFKGLALLLVILLFGVIYSAYSRLGLYIETYGLTELRFYSMAMIFWIGIVMFYFLAKLFSEKLPKIAVSYMFLGMLGVIALNMINPDGFITRTNLERSLANDKELIEIRTEVNPSFSSSGGSELDANYLSRLSADSVPVLLEYYRNYQDRGKGKVIEELLTKQFSKLDKANDWRAWNWGRARAKLYMNDFKSQQ